MVMLGAVVRCGRASHAAAISAAAPLRAFSGLVINCEDADEWKGSENLFIDRFQRPGESWSWCSPPRGELPDRDLRPDAVVVTGSHYSATLDAPWVHATSSWLRTVVEDPACRTRVFAVCFGHQLLSQALGGRVGRLAAGGFRFDEERIEPRPLFAAMPWARGIAELSRGPEGSAGPPKVVVRRAGFESTVNGSPSPFADGRHATPPGPGSAAAAAAASAGTPFLTLLKAHEDEVLEKPPSALTLASSDKVPFEMTLVAPSAAAAAAARAATDAGEEPDWASFRALTVQGHPEFLRRELHSKILPGVLDRIETGLKERLTAEQVPECALHDWAVLEIANRFLRRDVA